MNESHYEALMVKVVDDVASPAEREELMQHLVAHPELRQELEAQQALKALTDGWVARLEHDLHLDQQQANPVWRAAVMVGWMLLLGSTAALTFGTLYELWLDPEAPMWLTGSLALGVGGTVVLLVAAIWTRMRTHDPYSEVIR